MTIRKKNIRKHIMKHQGLLLCVLGHTQTLTGKLENPLQNMPEMDIVLWPLGMDSAVTIGKLTANGTLEFNFPEKNWLNGSVFKLQISIQWPPSLLIAFRQKLR